MHAAALTSPHAVSPSLVNVLIAGLGFAPHAMTCAMDDFGDLVPVDAKVELELAEVRRLQALGYTVEDMGAEWGPGWWDGQYRWFYGADEFCYPVDSAAQAWVGAWEDACAKGLIW